ncbi:hypothetical protein [Gracilimonas halophila]|uniref:Uncharacterized protein n=1 Tax=Gracilimonas halophila TaxID=1834464 RepID=A0ABW5JIF4_9BACT
MFKKIKAKIERLQQERPKLDLSHFDDPLAGEIDWFPLKGGGTNFKTRSLSKKSFNRYHFKATLGSLFFSGVFTLCGIGLPLGIILSNDLPIFSLETLGIVFFGSIFTGVGSLLGYQYLQPVVFDKSVGYFWKGWKEPEMYGRDNPKGAIRLSEIHAIQILAEYIRSDNSSYYSYELNLILRDGSRFNVIDHGKLDQMRKDAEELSSFLGKPVWDLTSHVNR